MNCTVKKFIFTLWVYVLLPTSLKGMECNQEALNENLVEAVRAGKVKDVELYLEQGAHPDYVGPETGEEPLLIFALRQNQVSKSNLASILDTLIKFNVGAAQPDKNGCSAVTVALVHQRYFIAEQLLNTGFFEDSDSALVSNIVHCRDGLGNTPLHYAAWYGCPRLASLLLAAGAKRNAQASYGITPGDLAHLYGHTDVLMLLDSQRDFWKELIHEKITIATILFLCAAIVLIQGAL